MLEVCRIHANVFAAPTVSLVGPTVSLRGLDLPTLVSPGGGPPTFDATMPPSFERMQERLLALPRSDCEPDGFFLVTGGKGSAPTEAGGFWRLNGHMHETTSSDGVGRMHRVELNGECPTASLDAVLKTLGWPDSKLVFELVQEGVTLAEPEFRNWSVAPTEPR